MIDVWAIRTGNPVEFLKQDFPKPDIFPGSRVCAGFSLKDNYLAMIKMKNSVCKLLHVSFFWFHRQERTQTQQLRDEQDEAYYESVRADQEKVSQLWLQFYFFLSQ